MKKKSIFLCFIMLFLSFLLTSCDLFNKNDGNNGNEGVPNIEVKVNIGDSYDLYVDSQKMFIEFKVRGNVDKISISNFEFNISFVDIHLLDENYNAVDVVYLKPGANDLTLLIALEDDKLEYKLLIIRDEGDHNIDLDGIKIDGAENIKIDYNNLTIFFNLPNKYEFIEINQIHLSFKAGKIYFYDLDNHKVTSVRLNEGRNELYFVYELDQQEYKVRFNVFRAKSEEHDKTPKDIRIDYYKKTYNVGDSFEPINVTLIFNNREEKAILGEEFVTDFDTSTPGIFKITINYGQIHKTIEIEVLDSFINGHTINICDYDGNIVKKIRVEDGTLITEDMMPKLNNINDMVFRGWEQRFPFECHYDEWIRPHYVSKDNLFNITIDLGTSMYDIVVEYGNQYILDTPEAPDSESVFSHFEYQGKEFSQTGWYNYRNNIVIEAVFYKNYNEINYLDCDNLKAPNPNPTIVKDGEIFELQPVEKEGYIFSRWVDENNRTITNVSFVGKNRTINIKAIYMVPITYENVTEEEALSLPKGYETTDYYFNIPALSREGYAFTGWYLDSELTNPFNYYLDGNPLVLYAGFSKYYNVIAGENTYEFYKGQSYYISSPSTSTGRRFEKYLYNGVEFPLQGIFEYDHDITLEISWLYDNQPIVYIGDYDSVFGPTTYNEGYNCDLYHADKYGYNFDGFYLEPEFITKVEKVPFDARGEFKVYVKFVIADRNLYYVLDYGEAVPEDAPRHYTPGTTLALPVCQKVGYEFLGWRISGQNDIINELYTEEAGDGISLVPEFKLMTFKLTIIITNTEKKEYLFKYNSYIGTLNPTRLGYNLEGLYYEGTNNRFDLTNYTVTNDLVLDAKWTLITYQISYNSVNNPNTIASYTVEDDPITLEPITMPGITFKYYGISHSNLNNDFYYGMTINTKLGGDVHVSDYGYDNFFNIYIDNGLGETTVIEGPYGGSVQTESLKVNAPYGYKISHFVDEENKTIDSVFIDRERHIKAIFTPIKYNIIYTNLRFVAEGTLPTVYTIESELTLPSVTLEGYIFEGYTINGVKTNTIAKGTTGNLAVSGLFTPNSYNVSFVFEDPALNYTIKAYYMEYFALPSIPPKGYNNILYEYNNQRISGEKQLDTPNDIEIKVLLSKNDNLVKLTFDLAGGTSKNKYPEFAIREVYFDLEAPVKTGYTFKGFRTQDDFLWIPGRAARFSKDSVLTAVWELTVYNIKYESNLGYETEEYYESYTIEDYNKALPSSKVYGYDDTGWFLNGKSVTVIPEGTLGDITLTTTYTVRKVNLTLNLNGASYDGPTVISTYYGATITLPKLVRYGYNLVLNLGSNSSYIDYRKFKITIENDDTVEYIYTPIDYYIDFEAGIYFNESTLNIPDNIKYNITSKGSLILPEASLSHYRFDGYYIDSELTIRFTEPNYEDLDNIRVYAKFTPLEYNLIIDYGDGRPNETIPYIPYADLVLPNPARYGYKFLGWRDHNKGSIRDFISTNSDKITAAWQKEMRVEFINHNIEGLGVIYTLDDYLRVSDYTPSKDGYIFVGWEDTKTKEVYGQNIEVYDGIILEPKFALASDSFLYEEIGNNELQIVGSKDDVKYLDNIIIPDTYNGKPVTRIENIGFRLESGNIILGANIKEIAANAITGKITTLYINDKFVNAPTNLLSNLVVNTISIPNTITLRNLYGSVEPSYFPYTIEVRPVDVSNGKCLDLTGILAGFEDKAYNLDVAEGFEEINDAYLVGKIYRILVPSSLKKLALPTNGVRLKIKDSEAFYNATRIYESKFGNYHDYLEDHVIVHAELDPMYNKAYYKNEVELASNILNLNNDLGLGTDNVLVINPTLDYVNTNIDDDVVIKYTGTTDEFNSLVMRSKAGVFSHKHIYFTHYLKTVETTDYKYILSNNTYIFDLEVKSVNKRNINIAKDLGMYTIHNIKENGLDGINTEVLIIPDKIRVDKSNASFKTVYCTGEALYVYVNYQKYVTNSTITSIENLENEKYKYILINGSIVEIVESLDLNATTINVGDDFRGFSVVKIHEDAFKKNLNLEKIILPSTIEEINYAFKSNLKTIELSNTKPLKIENNALANVETINFSSIEGLLNLSYNEDLTNVQERFININGSPLTRIDLTDKLIKLSFISILSKYNTPIDLILPDGISLGNIKGFDNEYKYNIYVSSLEAWANMDHWSSTLLYSSKLYINNELLTDVVLTPANMGGNTVPRYLFSGYKYLKNVTLDSGITNIGDSAFEGLNLNSFNAKDNIETIGESAFNSTTFVSQNIFKSSLKSIGSFAFMKTNITEFIMDHDYTIGNGAFVNSSLVRASVYSLPDAIFVGCINLESIELLKDIDSVGTNAFAGCSKLIEINLPTSVRVIGSGAFSDCTSLKRINGIENVTIINYEFISGSGLTEFTIPAGVDSIKDIFDGSNLITIKVDPNNKNYTSRDINNNECNMIFRKADNTIAYMLDAGFVPDTITGILPEVKNVSEYAKYYTSLTKERATAIFKGSNIEPHLIYNKSYTSVSVVDTALISGSLYSDGYLVNAVIKDITDVLDLNALFSNFNKVYLNLSEINHASDLTVAGNIENLADISIRFLKALRIPDLNAPIQLDEFFMEDKEIYNIYAANEKSFLYINDFLCGTRYRLYINNELTNIFHYPDMENIDTRRFDTSVNIKYVTFNNLIATSVYKGNVIHFCEPNGNRYGNYNFGRPTTVVEVDNEIESYLLADNYILRYKYKNEAEAMDYVKIFKEARFNGLIPYEIFTANDVHTKVAYLPNNTYYYNYNLGCYVISDGENISGNSNIKIDISIPYEAGVQYIKAPDFTYVKLGNRILNLRIITEKSYLNLYNYFKDNEVYDITIDTEYLEVLGLVKYKTLEFARSSYSKLLQFLISFDNNHTNNEIMMDINKLSYEQLDGDEYITDGNNTIILKLKSSFEFNLSRFTGNHIYITNSAFKHNYWYTKVRSVNLDSRFNPVNNYDGPKISASDVVVDDISQLYMVNIADIVNLEIMNAPYSFDSYDYSKLANLKLHIDSSRIYLDIKNHILDRLEVDCLTKNPDVNIESFLVKNFIINAEVNISGAYPVLETISGSKVIISNTSFHFLPNLKFVHINGVCREINLDFDKFKILYQGNRNDFSELDDADRVVSNVNYNDIRRIDDGHFDYYDLGNNKILINRIYGVTGEIDLTQCFIGKEIHLNNNAIGADNYITDLILPDSLRVVPYGLINGASNLKNVKFNEGLIRIEANAFSNTALTSVRLPSTLKYIGENAFMNSNISELILNDNIEYIKENAFYNNKLTSLHIGKEAKKIGPRAFMLNNISELIIDARYLYYYSDSAFDIDKLKSLKLENFEDEYSAFERIKYLDYLYLGNTREQQKFYCKVKNLECHATYGTFNNWALFESVDSFTQIGGRPLPIPANSYKYIIDDTDFTFNTDIYDDLRQIDYNDVTIDSISSDDNRVEHLNLKFIGHVNNLNITSNIHHIPSNFLTNLSMDRFEIPAHLTYVYRGSFGSIKNLVIPKELSNYYGNLGVYSTVIYSNNINFDTTYNGIMFVATREVMDELVASNNIKYIPNAYIGVPKTFEHVVTDKYEYDVVNGTMAYNLICKAVASDTVNLIADFQDLELKSINRYGFNEIRAIKHLYLPATLDVLLEKTLAQCKILDGLHVENVTAFFNAIIDDEYATYDRRFNFYLNDELIENLVLEAEVKKLTQVIIQSPSIKTITINGNFDTIEHRLLSSEYLKGLIINGTVNRLEVYNKNISFNSIVINGKVKDLWYLAYNDAVIIPNGIESARINGYDDYHDYYLYVPHDVISLTTNIKNILYNGTEEEFSKIDYDSYGRNIEYIDKVDTIEFKQDKEKSYFLVNGKIVHNLKYHNLDDHVEDWDTSLDLNKDFKGMEIPYVTNICENVGVKGRLTLILHDTTRVLSLSYNVASINKLIINDKLERINDLGAYINEVVSLTNNNPNFTVEKDALYSKEGVLYWLNNGYIPDGITFVNTSFGGINIPIFIPASLEKFRSSNVELSLVLYGGTEEQWNAKFEGKVTYTELHCNATREDLNKYR